MEQRYDVVVVGAGLAGSALVSLLAATTDWRIAVLEKNLPEAVQNPDPASRPISLAHASQQIFSAMGWWDALQDVSAPIKRVEVSQMGRMGVVNFQPGDFDLSALGYVVPYDFLQQALYQVMSSSAKVSYISSQEINSIAESSGTVTIDFSSGGCARQISTGLLVAADGAGSSCRSCLGIKANVDDRGAKAYTGELVLTRSHHQAAYQRFSNDGALAVLPLADERRARCVLSVTAEQAARQAKWSSARWLDFWRGQMRGRLGIDAVVMGQAYPLQTVSVHEVVRPGVVLLGNAAHTIYPLAAQGFNLALRDAAALVETLLDARACNPEDWASQATLASYAQWRQNDASEIQRITRWLADGFNLAWPGVDHLRGLALAALDALPWGKWRLGRQLLGLGGRVPKLARGVPVVPKVSRQKVCVE